MIDYRQVQTKPSTMDSQEFTKQSIEILLQNVVTELVNVFTKSSPDRHFYVPIEAFYITLRKLNKNPVLSMPSDLASVLMSVLATGFSGWKFKWVKNQPTIRNGWIMGITESDVQKQECVLARWDNEREQLKLKLKDRV